MSVWTVWPSEYNIKGRDAVVGITHMCLREET